MKVDAKPAQLVEDTTARRHGSLRPSPTMHDFEADGLCAARGEAVSSLKAMLEGG